jgi:hypothetical protein
MTNIHFRQGRPLPLQTVKTQKPLLEGKRRRHPMLPAGLAMCLVSTAVHASEPPPSVAYRADLTPQEASLFDRRNRLDPADPEQLQQRLAVEQSLNSLVLRRLSAGQGSTPQQLAAFLAAAELLGRGAEAVKASGCTVVEGLSPDSQQDNRRYVDNVAADARLVDTQGRLGVWAFDSTTFCNAVLTHEPAEAPPPSRGFVQIQGPVTAQGLDALAATVFHYARRTQAEHVFFINMAGTQIAPYLKNMGWAQGVQADVQQTEFFTGAQTATLAPRGTPPAKGLSASYIEYADWPDGLIVFPKRLAALAKASAATLHRHPKPLVVIGCNAGKDRSGLLNALLQLHLRWQHRGLPRDINPDLLQVIGGIQLGRPEALRSRERLLVLYHAAQHMADGFR